MTIYELVNSLQLKKVVAPVVVLAGRAEIFPPEETDVFFSAAGRLLIAINRVSAKFVLQHEKLCVMGKSDDDLSLDFVGAVRAGVQPGEG